MQLTENDMKIISNLLTYAYNDAGSDAENNDISYTSQLALTSYYYEVERKLCILFMNEQKKLKNKSVGYV
jgi:hypothetical protein